MVADDVAGVVSGTADEIIKRCAKSKHSQAGEGAVLALVELGEAMLVCDEQMLERFVEESFRDAIAEPARRLLEIMWDRGDDLTSALEALEGLVMDTVFEYLLDDLFGEYKDREASSGEEEGSVQIL